MSGLSRVYDVRSYEPKSFCNICTEFLGDAFYPSRARPKPAAHPVRPLIVRTKKKRTKIYSSRTSCNNNKGIGNASENRNDGRFSSEGAAAFRREANVY